ncbi:MAG: ATP-dependent RecD-like DNA helicase [Firmicutes bacterium]|nr:ATP-dependent RecD-like DNA helicase [Bacillota bacterium]
MEITFEGVIEKVKHHNAENGFSVFVVSATDRGDDEDVSCVGVVADINSGESIRITGIESEHPVYGPQVRVISYEKTEPKSLKAIELYLSSGAVKGIGAALAKRIIEKFGEKALEIMDKEPEKLSKVKGISMTKAVQIGEQYRSHAELRSAVLFLGQYGVTPNFALKIYKKYKGRTIDVVKKNPYSLADDLIGVGFKTADAIAAKIGIEKDSPFRIKAGIKYILNRAVTEGNVYLPYEETVAETNALLLVGEEPIKDCLESMHIENSVRMEGSLDSKKIYLTFFARAENTVAKRLMDLSSNLKETTDYTEDIRALEAAENIQLAEKQKSAVNQAMTNGVLVITGGPGTGKTTIIKTIIRLCQAEGYDVLLAAPTGRAAKRMEEATGTPAQTIHRLLGIKFLDEEKSRQTFDKNEENPLEADVIIIDESSMVDILIMNALLKAIPEGTRLILVGDADQLPSVGAGNVLRDIIASGVIKVVKLTEIYRQAEESAIVTNAHRINSGKYPEFDKKNSDFFMITRNSTERISSIIIDLVRQRLPAYLDCDPVDIQVLTPMRKNPLGSIALNTLLQEAINPPSPAKNERIHGKTVFREGDKVMQIKNNYECEWREVKKGKITDEGLGIYNGDEGIINYIDTEREFVEVIFDDEKVVHYGFTQLDQLELSYAVTVHKSQGSEYGAVIIPIFNGPELLMSRNLLYTGLTRAKKLAVIVGLPSQVNKMVDNNKEIERYTSLKEKLIEIANIQAKF